MEQVRKRPSLTRLIQEERKADLEDLRFFYRIYVCSHTCDYIVRMMKQRDLIRLIVMGIYIRNVIDAERDKGRIISIIIQALPIGRTSVFKYVNEAIIHREEERKRGAQKETGQC